MSKIVNPETGVQILASSVMAESGVHIDTNGRSQFSSPEEVMTWRKAVENHGLEWALLYFFHRTNFPQVK